MDSSSTGSTISMNIIGIDLGTTTGWASISHAGDTLLSRSGFCLLATEKELAAQREQGWERRLDLRFRRLLDLLEDSLAAGTTSLVVFEDVLFHRSQAQVQLWSRLSGAVWAAVHHYNKSHPASPVDIQAIPTGVLKHFATGNGGADKAEMDRALRSRYPTLYPASGNDNEIDAVWLSLYGVAWISDRSLMTTTAERRIKRRTNRK